MNKVKKLMEKEIKVESGSLVKILLQYSLTQLKGSSSQRSLQTLFPQLSKEMAFLVGAETQHYQVAPKHAADATNLLSLLSLAVFMSSWAGSQEPMTRCYHWHTLQAEEAR